MSSSTPVSGHFWSEFLVGHVSAGPVKASHGGGWTCFRANTIFVKIADARLRDFLDNLIAQRSAWTDEPESVPKTFSRGSKLQALYDTLHTWSTSILAIVWSGSVAPDGTWSSSKALTCNAHVQRGTKQRQSLHSAIGYVQLSF